MAKGSKKEKDAYAKFHGHTPRSRISLEVTTAKGFPKRLVFLAEAHSIVYRSDKKNGGGDGRSALYEHKFSKGTLLCTDPAMRQLYIVGKKLKVTDRGIEN